MYWPASRTNDHAASSLAKELIPAVGRSLVLVFGFVDCYKTTGYEFIESLSQTSGSMFSRLLFQLLAMGAQMRGLCDRTPRAFTDEDKDEFLCALARQYAKKFTGERAPSGPWIEFMDCMYGRAAVRMLNAFKRVIDETDHRPQDARFRSAARRLMTTLARDSRMLPSALHIEESRITFPSRNPFAPAAVKDAMRAGSGKDTGTSSIVSFGSMSCQKRKRIEVAIKGLTKSLGEKIVEDTYLEIIAGWTLRHERLLPTLGIVHYLEMLSIVSERMAGGNVRNYINTSNDFGRLPEGKRIAKLNFWLKQVAEGLKYMHDEGMAHGDLRGKNILIDSESDPGCNRIVIADFGLSLYVESISQAYKSTRVGNPRYLAPELQLRHNDVDDAAEIRALFSGPKFRISPSSRQNEASDLFSFAMLCVELYTGQEPFVASHPSAADWQVSNLILQGMRPTPLPTAIAAQPGLVRALERCWQQNPLHRGDAAALLADIGSLA
ncbi:uncharacterized protein PHACADRAFT_106353 [Phanerochaete carnosa HHB-10118-sp]|uniref:Protein kinase domain-containing protein n=1 Tax=Phanerochaete carnosa (strain HHB-10118-sp) TaxID=650164 RepID=K5VFF2_PHACS|nr:uncharacterized protein PHACADRAFT_106353 [Phanerochaete carnosa HHB-10118-sp]EKM49863.1 hypothetical protein PHACADRAFT_106353 [Phanerochaete carnosa HHB-10118-sp]